MIDIDRFKSHNDTHGHLAGDEILGKVAEAMTTVTRKADLLARYGGEEFCMVMTKTTQAGLTAAAERVRRAVDDRLVTLESGEEVHVTISVGGAATST